MWKFAHSTLLFLVRIFIGGPTPCPLPLRRVSFVRPEAERSLGRRAEPVRAADLVHSAHQERAQRPPQQGPETHHRRSLSCMPSTRERAPLAAAFLSLYCW